MSKSRIKRLSAQLADESRENLIEAISLLEGQRDKALEWVDALQYSLEEIRAALGLTDSDDHSAILDAIARLQGRERQN